MYCDWKGQNLLVKLTKGWEEEAGRLKRSWSILSTLWVWSQTGLYTTLSQGKTTSSVLSPTGGQRTVSTLEVSPEKIICTRSWMRDPDNGEPYNCITCRWYNVWNRSQYRPLGKRWEMWYKDHHRQGLSVPWQHSALLHRISHHL